MRVTTNISKMDLIRFNLAILPKLRSTYVTILVIALETSPDNAHTSSYLSGGVRWHEESNTIDTTMSLRQQQ